MNKLLCYIFGHKYRKHRKISYWLEEVKCKRCNKIFGMNHDVRILLPMDAELTQVHNELLEKDGVQHN